MMKDSNDNIYTEIKMSNGSIRLTYIENGWENSPSIRVQIKESNGHLRQGPEIPLRYFGNIFSSIIDLLSSKIN